MQPEVALALHKFHFKDPSKDTEDDLREAVGVGDHSIDTVVRIRGVMNVKPDQENVRGTTCVPWQQITAVLLSKLNGVTIEALVAEVVKGNGRVQEMAKELGPKAQAAIEAIIAPTYGRRRGAVKVEVEVTEVIL